jgi:glycosyltransferase involved in cell wall biosynthesis
MEADPQVVLPGFVSDTRHYYHLMDVVALPSYREGFPGVVLEANAAGKPVVAFRATGTVDAVVDRVTGILVPVGDVRGLGEALGLLLKNKTLNAEMGNAGRMRALREFQQKRIWEELAREYERLLERRGLPLPKTSERLAALSGDQALV